MGDFLKTFLLYNINMDNTIIIIILCILMISSSSGSVAAYFSFSQSSSATAPASATTPATTKSTTPTPAPAPSNTKPPQPAIDKTVKKCVQVDDKCISNWDCNIDDLNVGNVSIWWGHKSGDAGWACNKWVGDCKGLCTAIYNSQKIQQLERTEKQKQQEQKQEQCVQKGDKCMSNWDCTVGDINVNNVNIDWGHNIASGSWACNSWISECGGNCVASYNSQKTRS
jgi:hypothetical protein